MIVAHHLQEPGGFHRVTVLGPDDAGQRFGVDEEIVAGGEPSGVVGGDGAAGDDEVQVGMVLQLGAPGMEDRQAADMAAAEEPRVTGQLLQRRNGAGEERGIAGALVAPDDAPQGLGHRDGEQEVVARQQFLLLGAQPVPRLVVLTCRTVTVAAGAGQGMRGTALVAAVHGRAVGAVATVLDRAHDLLVHLGHAITVSFEVFRAKGAEDLLDGAHERIPCINWATR